MAASNRGTLDNSTDYVEAVMATQASQVITSVEVFDDRKRPRPDEEDALDTVKRSKVKGGMSTEECSSLEDNILGAISGMQSTFNERLDSLEEKITEKVLAAIRVELSDVRVHFDEEVRKLTEKVSRLGKSQAEFVDTTEKVKKLEKTFAEVTASNPALKHSIVIKNLKSDDRESTDRNVTINKVRSLVRDGLKLQNVKVVNAVRKTARGSFPGVIVADVETNEQKFDVLKTKRTLKGNANYSNVYIDNDLPADVRNTEASLRTILKELGKDKHYFARGTRLIRNTRH